MILLVEPERRGHVEESLHLSRACSPLALTQPTTEETQITQEFFFGDKKTNGIMIWVLNLLEEVLVSKPTGRALTLLADDGWLL